MQKFWKHLLELVMSGKLTPDMVITHNLPLSEAAKGYDMFHKKVGCINPLNLGYHSFRLVIWQPAWDADMVCIPLQLDINAQPEDAMHLLRQACTHLINSTVLSQAICLPAGRQLYQSRPPSLKSF